MITIKDEREIELIRHAGKLISLTHSHLKKHIKAGITTKKLDELAYDFILSNDAYPTCLGYEGFPASICTSVNDTVVHGIPNDRKLKEGDVITIDMVICYKGYNADAAWTYLVGNVSDEKKYLLKHTKNALLTGIKEVKPGNRIGDISSKIEEYANKYNLGIIRELCGHGIGTNMHEAPDIPNFGTKNTGPRLKEGMVICIEPMLCLGNENIYVKDDEWTVNTIDKSAAAHFEHTILVTKDGYEILTPRLDDDDF